MQLQIFTTGTNCSHCNKDPGLAENPNLWNGFFDQDTKQHVCWSCRKQHYQQKSKTQYAHMYSELPVINKSQISK